jgi:hypothetical protein
MRYSQFSFERRLTLFMSLLALSLVAGLALAVPGSQAATQELAPVEAQSYGQSADALAAVGLASLPPQSPWNAQYFSNPSLKGKPALERSDARLAFNWGAAAPAAGLPADNFSARWTQKVHFPEGIYHFCVTADDGVRVEMDDQSPFIRQWHDSAGTYCVDKFVTRGLHKVRVEFYEHLGQAKIQFWWEKLSWKAEYFSNRNLRGQPALVRSDATIDFSWGTGRPASGLPADNFSVRWTNRVHFAEGTYRFCVTADDGVRVEMDDQRPFIRQWHDGVGTYCADVHVAAGIHKVRVEYYEHLGQAKAKFWWEKRS